MRIALATCRRPTERDQDFDFIASALRRRGAEAVAPVWNDERVEWGEFDLVMISSTWDYPTQLDRFREWLAAVDDASRLRNPLGTIEWNIDKRYLRELEAAGVATIPTIWTEPGEEAAALERLDAAGWKEVVIKPVVDLGAERLARVDSAIAPRILEAVSEPAMIQPYLDSLEREGERSLVFCNGELLHAVVKRAAPGDFRIQPQYGGRHELIGPSGAELETARAALAAAPADPAGDPLYARVDLVAAESGRTSVIELELIEPYLYLDVAPAGAEVIANALLAAAA